MVEHTAVAVTGPSGPMTRRLFIIVCLVQTLQPNYHIEIVQTGEHIPCKSFSYFCGRSYILAEATSSKELCILALGVAGPDSGLENPYSMLVCLFGAKRPLPKVAVVWRKGKKDEGKDLSNPRFQKGAG